MNCVKRLLLCFLGQMSHNLSVCYFYTYIINVPVHKNKKGTIEMKIIILWSLHCDKIYKKNYNDKKWKEKWKFSRAKDKKVQKILKRKI